MVDYAEVIEKLLSTNVNSHTEKKNNLTISLVGMGMG